jgi:hypothetical protein
MVDEPKETGSSNEEYRFANPTYEVISEAEARIEKAFSERMKRMPRKELSDKAEKAIDPNSLAGLLNAREAENFSAWNSALYSIGASMVLFGTNVIRNDALEKIGVYNLHDYSADFAEGAAQVMASPITGVLSYCTMILGALLIFRAIGARISANNFDKRLKELEKQYRKHTKHYKRFISS